MTTKLHTLLLSALMLMFLASPASAFIVAGSQMGDNVLFEWEDPTLFGTPTVVGDTLMFTPTAFKAQSAGMVAPDLVNRTFLIRVTAKDNVAGLALANIIENGDWFTTTAMVNNASVFWGLGTYIDGEPESEILSSDLLDTPSGVLTPWGTEHNHELDGQTSIILTIQNTLVATSGMGSTALIEKKGLDIEITTTPVPVPAAVWMFGSVLATLGLFRKKAQAEA